MRGRGLREECLHGRRSPPSADRRPDQPAGHPTTAHCISRPNALHEMYSAAETTVVVLASVWRLNVSSPSMLLVVRLSTVYPSFFLFLFLLSVTRGMNPLV